MIEIIYGLILIIDYFFIQQNNIQIIVITCLIIYILFSKGLFQNDN